MPELDDIIPGGTSGSTQTTVKFSDSLKINQEEDLALKVAIQLYTYGDFNSIQNPQDFAKECLHRGNEFVKGYKIYKTKNKIETV